MGCIAGDEGWGAELVTRGVGIRAGDKECAAESLWSTRAGVRVSKLVTRGRLQS